MKQQAEKKAINILMPWHPPTRSNIPTDRTEEGVGVNSEGPPTTVDNS
jgi:hypothetical protein